MKNSNKVYTIFCSTLFLLCLHVYISKKYDFKQLLADQNCWKNHFSLNFTTVSNLSFFPATIDEAPIGYAPSVPKSFIIEEKQFCHQKNLKIIAYVHSAIKNTRNRQITRDTWVSGSKQIGTIFIVGNAKNEAEQKIVDTESKKFHDIVQGNYTDLYELLTYKALNSLHWLIKNCRHIPWVIHADDDVLIDVNMMLKAIDGFGQQRRISELFCFSYNASIVKREGKWTVSSNEFPCLTYPVYCAGPMWFTSMEVIKKLYDNIPKVKYLWVDDTYLTGLIAEVSNIHRTHMQFGIDSFHQFEIGKYLAWLNIKSNRTEHWQAIVSYYL